MRNLIVLSICFLFFLACGSKNIETKRPSCESMEDVVKFEGTEVTLTGKHYARDAGKTWIAGIKIKDGTSLVYSYGISQEDVKKYKGKKIKILGTVYPGIPPSDYPEQRIIAPHVISVKSIEIIE